MLKKRISTPILLATVTACMWPHSAHAVNAYNSVRINPAVVSNPQVLSYSQCIDRYGMCGCQIVGMVEGDRNMIDSNGDNQITAAEMMTFKNGGMFNTEVLSDNRFLACHYEPIPPGPYSGEECYNIVGQSDCVCVGAYDRDAQCFIRSITVSAPQPIEVPEGFCSTHHPNGFDCFCTTETVVYSGHKKCFVQAPPQQIDSDCFDEIRIFKGSTFSCVSAKLWGAWSTDCCELPCHIQEYDPQFDVMAYAQYGVTALQYYTRYLGYEVAMTNAGIAGQATFGNWAQTYFNGFSSLEAGGVATGGGTVPPITALNDAYTTFASSSSDMITSTLGQMSPYLGYIGTAYAVYQLVSTYLNQCGQHDYELACKRQADLCISVGRYRDDSFRYQSYMCYESQIARVVNQYGLPQLYPNEPYGPAEHPRSQGFSVGEFERLDFSQIPLEEELIKNMLPPAEAQQYFASTANPSVTNFVTPSVFTGAESEASLDSRTPEIPVAPESPVEYPVYGQCGAFPATSTEIHSVPSTEFFNIHFCTQEIGRYYINYSITTPECLGCIGIGTGCDPTCHQTRCQNAYSDGGAVFSTNQLLSGFAYPAATVYGADCIWIGDYALKFYNTLPWIYGNNQKVSNIMFANVLQQDGGGGADLFFGLDTATWLDIAVWRLQQADVERGDWVSSGKCVDFDPATPSTAPTTQPELINNCQAGSIPYNGSNLTSANCFCSCPPLEEDMARSVPICPRPHKSNLVQRTVVVNDAHKAIYNSYFNRSDVRTTYGPLVPNFPAAP